jgi:hypothetical protein
MSNGLSQEDADWLMSMGAPPEIVATLGEAYSGPSVQEAAEIQSMPLAAVDISQYSDYVQPGGGGIFSGIPGTDQQLTLLKAGLTPDWQALLGVVAPAIVGLLGGGALATGAVALGTKLLTSSGGDTTSTALTTTNLQAGGNARAGVDFVYKGVLFQGPGIKEPPPGMIIKHWYIQANTHKLHFFKLANRKMVCIDEETGQVSVWTPKKMMVLSKNPRIPQLLKAAKFVDNTMLRLHKRMGKFERRTRTPARRK